MSTVAPHPTARKLGAAFATVVCREPAAIDLWASKDRDGIHLWLLVAPIEDEQERHLYGLLAALDERFREADYQLHILNPTTFVDDPRAAIPADAEHIPLRAA